MGTHFERRGMGQAGGDREDGGDREEGGVSDEGQSKGGDSV